jgi:hypothetical protein
MCRVKCYGQNRSMGSNVLEINYVYGLMYRRKYMPRVFAFWIVHFRELNKKLTSPLIIQCIDTRHSPTRFGTLKCHNQGDNYDPVEIGAQCRRNLKDKLKYISNHYKMYSVVQGVHWWSLYSLTINDEAYA